MGPRAASGRFSSRATTRESISWWEGDSGDVPLSLAMMIVASLCCSMGLVDLFSIGAGFGIYVNHRTWVEGWDVELAFRRLGNRLRGIVGMLVIGLVLSLSPSLRADGAGEAIEQVLAHEDFEVHKETIKTPKFDWFDGWN